VLEEDPPWNADIIQQLPMSVLCSLGYREVFEGVTAFGDQVLHEFHNFRPELPTLN
jgi:hypothetical protein